MRVSPWIHRIRSSAAGSQIIAAIQHAGGLRRKLSALHLACPLRGYSSAKLRRCFVSVQSGTPARWRARPELALPLGTAASLCNVARPPCMAAPFAKARLDFTRLSADWWHGSSIHSCNLFALVVSCTFLSSPSSAFASAQSRRLAMTCPVGKSTSLHRALSIQILVVLLAMRRLLFHSTLSITARPVLIHCRSAATFPANSSTIASVSITRPREVASAVRYALAPRQNSFCYLVALRLAFL